jgi:hypothetical protein
MLYSPAVVSLSNSLPVAANFLTYHCFASHSKMMGQALAMLFMSDTLIMQDSCTDKCQHFSDRSNGSG